MLTAASALATSEPRYIGENAIQSYVNYGQENQKVTHVLSQLSICDKQLDNAEELKGKVQNELRDRVQTPNIETTQAQAGRVTNARTPGRFIQDDGREVQS